MTIEFTDPKTLSAEELEIGAIFAPKFDDNGLVTAVAIDAKDQTILMLAHMTAEAVHLTLQTNEVHYYSRSRQKIWKKGESSGEIQRLVEMRVDCDQDALILFVEQTGRGAACHTGRKSCFFRSVVPSNDGVALDITGGSPLFDPKDVYK